LLIAIPIGLGHELLVVPPQPDLHTQCLLLNTCVAQKREEILYNPLQAVIPPLLKFVITVCPLEEPKQIPVIEKASLSRVTTGGVGRRLSKSTSIAFAIFFWKPSSFCVAV
jgi:hypothetical protein